MKSKLTKKIAFPKLKVDNEYNEWSYELFEKPFHLLNKKQKAIVRSKFDD